MPTHASPLHSTPPQLECAGVWFVNDAYKSGKKIITEGANAAMLDLDYGTYPFVTSSTTTAGGLCTGLGLSPDKVDCTVGVVKAYTTRVGWGPFPTELTDDLCGGMIPRGAPGTEIGKHMQDVGAEYGVTTGRKRRCGWCVVFMLLLSLLLLLLLLFCLRRLIFDCWRWEHLSPSFTPHLLPLHPYTPHPSFSSPTQQQRLDMPVVQYGAMLNGYTSINMTKLDVLDDLEELKIGVAYKVDGKTLPPGSIPSTLAELEKVEVEYETLPGWKQSIAHCRDFSELPAEAQVSRS